MGQRAISENTLFYGDNLDILRQHIADECIDLIYLDPPFNSSRNYNVLYKDESGEESQSQILAFEDTWHWSKDNTEPEFLQLQQNGDNLSDLLTTLVRVMGRNQMSAYLVMMSNRLIELRRVLKPSGSLYLHCDPTASHYLKMILDMIFGASQFQGEIIWQRTTSHVTSKRWARLHDVIICLAKDIEQVKFNPPRIKPDNEWVKREYRFEDERGQYMLDNLTGAGITNGPSGQPWRDIDPKKIGAGRHWRYIPETLDKLDSEGRIYWPKKGKYPKLKQYLQETGGKAVGDLWTDISVLGRTSAERLGYPTQKPVALLERIISASSNPGDVVLDPFCGCGTAVHAAQKLGRVWAGIDITPLATTLIKSRLHDAFGIQAKKDYHIIGEPITLSDAQHLAKQDRYLFQWWALGLLPARPYGGQADEKKGKKGADKGVDGIMTFQDTAGGAHKRIIVQVKSGKVSSRDIRDLNGTVDREKNAVIGVFVTLENPSRNMEMEALEAGRYRSEGFNRDYPKIQILTIEQLLSGEKVQFPGTDTTLKQAQREMKSIGEQQLLSTYQ